MAVFEWWDKYLEDKAYHPQTVSGLSETTVKSQDLLWGLM